MTVVTLADAQAPLPDLVQHLASGDEVVITVNDPPVAKLVAIAPDGPRPVFGRGRGTLVIVSEDDDHLTAWQ